MNDSFEQSSIGQEAMSKSMELFHMCDEEGKGFIIKRDMQRLSSVLPDLTGDQLEEVFDSLDQDHNGFLTVEEFTRGFGAFLGLQMPSSEDEAQTSSANETGGEEIDDKMFDDIMTELSSNSVLKDTDTVKRLWTKMRKEDPNMLQQFEDFLTTVTKELSKSKEDFSALEQALTHRSTHHDDEVRRLYDEMEHQIKAEKERVANEERIRAQREREEVEREMMERDKQLQELMNKHKEERESLAREKDQLEGSLHSAKSNLEDTSEQLDHLKKIAKDEKRKRAMQSFKVTEGIASERENLVKQLEGLRLMNKKLQDERDELASKNKLQAELSARDRDRERLSDIDRGMQSIEKQLLRQCSGESDGVEVDDDFLSSAIVTSPAVMGGPGPGSLLDELGGGFQPPPPAVAEVQGPRVETNGFDASNPERVFKVVFVGDSGVGKTCFLHRYCQNKFSETFAATIGVDFQVKSLWVEGRVIALQLWDTAGQERFRSITKQYFRKADGVVLVYDVTNEQSYLDLRNWFQSVQDGVADGCVLTLIGNKIDLCADGSDRSRALQYKDGQKLAEEYGALFFETSAQTGEGMSEAMHGMAALLCEREDNYMENAVKLTDNQPYAIRKKGKCCSK